MSAGAEATRPLADQLMEFSAQSKAANQPLVTMFSRQRRAVRVSPFDTDGAANFVALGNAGAGKSVLAMSMCSETLAVGGPVWIVDASGAYRNMCEAFGGRYVEPSNSAGLGVAPFRFVEQIDDDLEALSSIFGAMIEDSGDLSLEQRGRLMMAIHECWDAHGKSATVSQVADVLEQSESAVSRSMGERLRAFTSVDVNRRHFEDGQSLRGSKLTVFDLSGVASRPQLQRVLFRSILLYARYAASEYRGRSMLILDETWRHFGQDEAFWTNWRSFRMLGASTGFLASSYRVLKRSSLGEQILFGASMYLLRQDPEDIRALEGDRVFGADPNAYAELHGLRTRAGLFSEMVVRAPFVHALCRLVLNPAQKVVFTSPWALLEKRKSGMGLAEAVCTINNERQQGAMPAWPQRTAA